MNIKPEISEVYACAITLQANNSTSSSINISEFQDKIAQLQEKGILKTSNKFNSISETLTRNGTATDYFIEVDWHSYSDATGYRIYRSVNETGYVSVYDWVAPTGYDWYGFYDWEVIPGNNYAYYVIAYGCGWKTDMSEIVTIDTFLPHCSLISPLNGVTITNPNPVFKWSPVGISSFPYGSIYEGDSDLYVYDISADELVWWRFFYDDMTVSSITYNDNGYATPLVSGHDYYWESWAYGYDENGNLIAMSWSEDWEFTYTGE